MTECSIDEDWGPLSIIDKSEFQETTNSWGSLDQRNRIDRKEELIKFYNEEKHRRRKLHRKEKEDKIKTYNKTLTNLKYLLELERQRTI